MAETDKVLASKENQLKTAMEHLSTLESCIDDWKYPIGIKQDVGQLLDNYYGKGNRPGEDTLLPGSDTILRNIKAAINTYHQALTNRMHGRVAASDCLDEIQTILGMHWKG